MGFILAIRNVKVLIATGAILAMSFLFCAHSSDAYEGFVNEIIDEFAFQMEKEFKAKCIGSGGCMPHGVEEIEAKFVLYEPLSIEQARILEVKAVEKFLKIINDHEKIRPFLKAYPFDSSRINVGLSFYDTKNNYQNGKGVVAYVSLIKNIVYYDKANPKTDGLEDWCKEPYEEAVKLVRTSEMKK